MQNVFEFIIDDIKLVSTNDAYLPTYKGHRSFIRRSSALLEFQKVFQEKAEGLKDSAYAFIEAQRKLYENLGLRLELVFVLPRDVYFYKRKDDLRPQDTSNFIKTTEDQIALLLGVDDKYNLEVLAKKCYDTAVVNSSIHVKISCYDYKAQTKEKILGALKEKGN